MQSGAPTLPELSAPSFGRRLMSLFYESLLALAIAYFSALVFHWIAGEPRSAGARHGLQLYLFLILGLYFVGCWSHGGRTLPMQTWKMRIVRSDGRSVGVGQALVRYVLAWPSLLLCVGLLWALIDRDRQFLHDRLSGTRIVPLRDAAERFER